MREYIRVGFAQEQKERELARLDAILQALRNCHKSLGTINGGEEKTMAIQDIAAAHHNVTTMRNGLTEKALPNTRTVEAVFDDFEEDSLGD